MHTLRCVLPETAGAVINRKDNEWSAMSSNHVVKAARISGQVTNDTERPGARVKDSASAAGKGLHNSESGEVRDCHTLVEAEEFRELVS